ncbi:hypothetical protein EXIGLDRAFT_781651 [Exidia glandulosa HHB12029]|uniref:Uncharacterized protein n=1 Tax=Exidia glandulosa HHB12029 TaxID=1314781 RepID=A0A165B6H4_EXIGL|nr:hypothetical protein EXIGLDRAFT_781651 [Exidia glandulosa HHB12029]
MTSNPSSESSTPELDGRGSPPFYSLNDDLRARFGRTRKEYEEMHAVLATALASNDKTSFELFDRRWDDLLNVMDARDYWEARCVRYHSKYLAEVARSRDYKDLVRLLRSENDLLRGRIKDQKHEIGRLQVRLDERTEREAVMDIERELLDDLESVLAADELREANIREGEVVMSQMSTAMS